MCLPHTMWVALSGVSPAMRKGWTLGRRVCDRSGEGAGVGPDYSRLLKPRRGISFDVRDNGKLHGLLGQQPGSHPSLNVPGLCQGLQRHE